MTIRRFATLLLCGLAVAGCEKNGVQDLTGPFPSAKIKFFNFGVNAPDVNFYANDVKMTATYTASGEESENGVGYGGVGAGDLYTAIEPGQYTITGRISAAENKDVPISSLTATIADGKSYSYYQSGFYDPATKTVDAFIVEDPYPAEMDYEHVVIRFVNAISNSEPMTLYATNLATGETTAIGGSVAYKSAGEFTAIPEGAYDISARTAGSTEDAIVRTAVAFEDGRVYTIAAYGDITVTDDTQANAPFLDRTTNR